MSNEPTPALAEQLRAPGWYWVNVAVGEEGDIWVPACWRPSTGTWPDHSAWFLADSSEQMRCDDELLEIGPRIPSPDEAPTDRRGVEADGWNEAVEACAVRMAEYMAQEQPMNGSITEACAVLRALKRPAHETQRRES